MNPMLLTLSLAFGLMPFNRNSLKQNYGILDYVLMFITPIIYFTCYFMTTLGPHGIYRIKECISICRLGNKLFMHVGCFLFVTVYLLSMYRRKIFYLKFEDKMQEIDELIENCEKVADNRVKVQDKKHMYYLAWFLVTIVFVFDIGFDIRNMRNYYYKFYILAPVLVTVFPFLAGSVVQGQFIYHISLIAYRFKKLNLLFEKISKECDKKNAPISVFDIESEGKKQEDGKVSIRGNKQSEKSTKIEDLADTDSSDDDEEKEDNDYDKKIHPSDNATSEANLPLLFKLHDKILSLSVLTNAEFGPQCVPYMASCFAISIFGIFLETKVIFIVGGKDQLLDYIVYVYVIWSLSTMIVAYLVLRLCCNTNAKSKESAMIVHEIMQKKPTFMLGNDLYYNKMKAFTLQFLHWEGFFQFNGIGLFALDYTFIFSTVSAATSYLIVLLQFDMTTILKNEGLMPQN